MKTDVKKEINKKELKDEFTENIRPSAFSSYIGQEKIKKIVSVSIAAAKERNEPLDHMLFYGPPGLGKTTISCIIANEMGSNIKITTGPAIEKPGDLVAILLSLNDGDILFLDEIHRINRNIEEILYPAMEDYAIDIMTGEGVNKRSVRLTLPKFTLIGATTRVGMLTAPLRDRFGTINRMEYYTDDELKSIVLRTASILNVNIDNDGALEIAKRSRGTPRLANRLLKQVRDFAQVEKNNCITKDVSDSVLRFIGVNDSGLDDNDVRYLESIFKIGNGSPVGLTTIAAAISEDEATIEDVYEPFLIQEGFVNKTPKGRQLTGLGLEQLGIEIE